MEKEKKEGRKKEEGRKAGRGWPSFGLVFSLIWGEEESMIHVDSIATSVTPSFCQFPKTKHEERRIKRRGSRLQIKKSVPSFSEGKYLAHTYYQTHYIFHFNFLRKDIILIANKYSGDWINLCPGYVFACNLPREDTYS